MSVLIVGVVVIVILAFVAIVAAIAVAIYRSRAAGKRRHVADRQSYAQEQRAEAIGWQWQWDWVKDTDIPEEELRRRVDYAKRVIQQTVPQAHTELAQIEGNRLVEAADRLNTALADTLELADPQRTQRRKQLIPVVRQLDDAAHVSAGRPADIPEVFRQTMTAINAVT
ncbi:hypothetical protein GCM10009624_18240 [Gordonia sinesedis]